MNKQWCFISFCACHCNILYQFYAFFWCFTGTILSLWITRDTKHTRWWEWLHNKQTTVYLPVYAFFWYFTVRTFFCMHQTTEFNKEWKDKLTFPSIRCRFLLPFLVLHLETARLSPRGSILFNSATIANWYAFLASFWRELNIKWSHFQTFYD